MGPEYRTLSIPLAIIATVAVFWVLAVGKNLLVPLAVAVMIWYIINALSRTYARYLLPARKMNWLSLLLSLLTIGLATSLAVDLIQNNIAAVTETAPTYREKLQGLIDKLSRWVGVDKVPTLGELVKTVDIAPTITRFAGALTGIIGNLGLVVIYVLFLLIEQNTFVAKIERLFPEPGRQRRVLSMLSHMQAQIQTYIWIKTLVSLATGSLGFVVLWLVGVDYAGFWAFTIFLLNYIPTIGSVVATVFPALLALLQFDTLTPFLIVALGLTGVQFVAGNLVEPRLMGNTLNLSPLVVLLSLALWGSVWGVAGMFLCVPITVMMLIVLSHFDNTRPIAVLLSSQGNLTERQSDQPRRPTSG